MQPLKGIAITLVLLVSLAWAAATEGIPDTPGFHRNISCLDHPNERFEMYIPAVYAEHPDRLFPVLLISSPTAKPHTSRFKQWAEDYGFVVIGLLNSRNGPYEPNKRNQDAVDHTLEKSGLRIHPHLRYALGGSGGGMSGYFWVARKPNQFAGCHVAIQSGGDDNLAKHVVLTFFARTEDPNIPISLVDQAVERHRRNGNEVRYDKMAGDHSGPPAELQESHVAWMYWRSLLSHPAHKREDLEAGLQIIRERRERLAAEENLARRQQLLAELLEVPIIRQSPEGEPLVQLWVTGMQQQVEASQSELERMWAIIDASEKAWFGDVDATLRREYGKQLRTFARDPALKNEHLAWQAYSKASAMAESARSTREREEAAAAFRTIAERLPDTRYGKMAAER